MASLAGLFGIVALLLAAVGCMALRPTLWRSGPRDWDSHGPGRRSRQSRPIGAGGASRRVGIGLLLGVPLAIGAGRLISTQLYGVSSWDPMALGIAAAALAISAFFAAVIPARRAASISPMKALRTE